MKRTLAVALAALFAIPPADAKIDPEEAISTTFELWTPAGEVASGNTQTGAILEGYFDYNGYVVTNTPLVIGGRPLNVTFSYEAVQAELVLFEVVPSSADEALLEAWMMQKWGL
jgi:hypothetical protein